MDQSWQTPAALAVVGLVLLTFIVRYLRGRKTKKSGACGTGCACPAPLAKTEKR